MWWYGNTDKGSLCFADDHVVFVQDEEGMVRKLKEKQEKVGLEISLGGQENIAVINSKTMHGNTKNSRVGLSKQDHAASPTII